MTILAVLVPVLLGCALTRVVWPNGWRVCRHDFFRASLGVGLGLGLGSCIFFLSLALGWPGAALPVEALLVAALAALYARARAPIPCGFCATAPHDPKWNRLPSAAAGLAAASALAIFVLFSVMAPLGESDAWSIWNLRAKFLALGGKNWLHAFSPVIAWSHPDYPLLIPASVAQAWKAAGGASWMAPVLVAGLLTFAAAGLVYSSVEMLRGRLPASLALIALLGASSFARNGAAQYADVPLSFFLLATAVLLSLEERSSSAAVLAGLSAGLAAWTKNEGMLFAAGAILAQMLLLRRGASAIRRFLSGFAPVAAVLLLFKLRYAGPNDLAASMRWARLADFDRYWTVGYQVISHILTFGGYVVSPVLVLGAYAWLLGVQREERMRPRNRALLFLLFWMLAGDFLVYVLAPSALDWQLETSLGRVLLQLWPLAVLTLFCYVSAPQQMVKATQKPVSKASPRPAKRAPTARLRTMG